MITTAQYFYLTNITNRNKLRIKEEVFNKQKKYLNTFTQIIYNTAY